MLSHWKKIFVYVLKKIHHDLFFEMSIKILLFSWFCKVIRMRINLIKFRPRGKVRFQIFIEIVLRSQFMRIFDMIDILIRFKIVVNRIWLEYPFEMIKMRSMIVIMNPTALSKQSFYVIVFRIEDKNLTVCWLSTLLKLSRLFADIIIGSNHVLRCVDCSYYCFWCLDKLWPKRF